MADSKELIFQNTIVDQMKAAGWLVGTSDAYDRENALYTEDVLAYVQEATPDAWEKFAKHNPKDADDALIRSVTRRLEKDGTLSVLRHGYKDKGTRLRFCQFKPDHDLNPDTQQRYQLNRLRVVPELTYSPHHPE